MVAARQRAQVVIVGGGIVGCSLAYHLTRLGRRDVLVLDQGPLFHNRGSTSHAPGLMFQHNASRAMTRLAMWSVEAYASVRPPGGEAFFQVGSMELATTPARLEELRRRLGQAMACGLDAALIGAGEARRLVPLLRPDGILGALHVPSDCVVRASAVAEALAGEAQRAGARLAAHCPVTGIDVSGGGVRAVETPTGRIETETLVLAAGIWGPLLGELAGVPVPLTPVQHLFAKTTPLAALAGETAEVRHPILRHQDRDLYFRQYGDRYGFGSYRHEPLLLDAERIPQDDHPAILPFTPEHFAESLEDARELLPALRQAGLAERFNGLFSFTPDGFPLLGAVPGGARPVGRRGGVDHPRRGRRPGPGRVDGRRQPRPGPARVRRRSLPAPRHDPAVRAGPRRPAVRGGLRRRPPPAAGGAPPRSAPQPVLAPAGGAARGVLRERRLGAPAVVRRQRGAPGRPCSSRIGRRARDGRPATGRRSAARSTAPPARAWPCSTSRPSPSWRSPDRERWRSCSAWPPTVSTARWGAWSTPRS